MSAVDDVLTEEVERLTAENNTLVYQNEHLAKLLAETLNILDRFKRNADDTLRHFGCQQNAVGKHSWKKLLNR